MVPYLEDGRFARFSGTKQEDLDLVLKLLLMQLDLSVDRMTLDLLVDVSKIHLVLKSRRCSRTETATHEGWGKSFTDQFDIFTL